MIPLAFVKATRCKGLHLFMVGKLLFLFLLSHGGSFYPDHNGLRHLEALVHWRRSSRQRLAPSHAVHRTEPSFCPGIAVGSPREVPPGCRNTGLVHVSSNVARGHTACRPHCWINSHSPRSAVGTDATINSNLSRALFGVSPLTKQGGHIKGIMQTSMSSAVLPRCC